MNIRKIRISTLFVLYVVGFIFALRSALPSYINSSFLSGISSEKMVGIIYTLCSVLTLFIFVFVLSKLLNKIGNYRTILFFLFLNIISLFGLSIFKDSFLLILCFIISYSATTISAFCLDIFIEHNSTDGDTGKIRSFYLTSINLAWLMSPWLASLIVNGGDYWKVYMTATAVMIPIFLIISYNLKSFKDSQYQHFHLLKTVREVWKNKDIRCILVSNFLLQSFFACMIIYTPIYLNEYIGFSWYTIGLIFTIMLLPFVFIQIPLGKIADKKLGEKELLTFGFIVMAISTGLITYIEVKTFWIWAILLFLTRIGAATVEVMTEVYFFKNINEKDVNLMSLFRIMTPFAYIVAPVLATMFLYFFDYQYIFLALAFVMLFGIRYSLAIKDTR
ncbi:MAG: MFS transporter [Candidatus Paceibacterota bacterium]|jgi:MFS family permease